MLAVLVALALAAALAVRSRADAAPLPLARRVAAGALVAVLAATVLAAATGGHEGAPAAGQAQRLVSVQSNRYAYWRVAVATFADHPLRGIGAGGFAVEWLRERPVARPAQDAHSLPIETLAELGLIGAAALALLAGAIVAAARRLQRVDPVLAAGPAAALAAYAFHASIDWDWEMPALTLVAVALAGLLLAAGERSSASTATAPSTTSPGSAANRNRDEP
jgi:O-antigen ligase